MNHPQGTETLKSEKPQENLHWTCIHSKNQNMRGVPFLHFMRFFHSLEMIGDQWPPHHPQKRSFEESAPVPFAQLKGRFFSQNPPKLSNSNSTWLGRIIPIRSMCLGSPTPPPHIYFNHFLGGPHKPPLYLGWIFQVPNQSRCPTEITPHTHPKLRASFNLKFMAKKKSIPLHHPPPPKKINRDETKKKDGVPKRCHGSC